MTQANGPSSAVPLDLLERETELAAVAGHITAAHAGGRVLVIEGPPGIGKSALIAGTKTLAQRAGWQVLSGRGSELERSFSYGVIRQLFEPAVVSLGTEERSELLSGAAGLAAPLVDPAQVAAEPSADSSLAMLHGLYWLTANFAVRAPLLLAVDDLHWCDLASLRWLAYLLPRMEGLGLFVVVALRPQESGEDPGLVAQIVSDPVAAVIRPAPLSRPAAAVLVRKRLSLEAEDAFCAACWEETAGNPLLLRELVHAIADQGLPPIEANVAPLRELGARAGSRAVSLRLSRLPPEATALAQAVAILGDDADARQAAALAGLSAPAASVAADALVRADVLRSQPALSFVHPLVRAAVYESLTSLDRDAGHARAALLLADAGADPERVAAHLLRSPPAADAQTVATLRDVARRAAGRGAAESAVAYLRRALAEPPPSSERAELLLELGSAEVHVDGDSAIAHLQQAHALVDEPIARAEIALLLGRQLIELRGNEAHTVFITALEELGGADPELERLLEVGLITNDLFQPSLHAAASDRLERVRRQPAADTLGEKLLLSLLANHDARAGVPAAQVVPWVRRALAGGSLVRDYAPATLTQVCAVLAMTDLDEALTLYEDLLAEAHRRGSVFVFATAKMFHAKVLAWRGDLTEAEADASEAMAAAAVWGASARLFALGAVFLAEVLMEQGRLDEAAAALARAYRRESLPDSARLYFLQSSNAQLRLLRGDLAGGVAEMLDAGRRLESVGSRNPAFIAWRSPAALALLQLGQQDQARRLAAEELDLARTWGAPRAVGAALRAAGLTEGGERGLELLEEAVLVLNNSVAKLEHAKARTDLGAALRRANRRTEARNHLRRAIELATICGAAPLAARGESELLATGARPRRIALSGVDSLTPSEQRVAELAASGSTNRQIAQALFITQRTVEVHLTSIYRKLTINSRAQLAAALAESARTYQT